MLFFPLFKRCCASITRFIITQIVALIIYHGGAKISLLHQPLPNGDQKSHDYLFDSERRYKTLHINAVNVIIRMAREILKNRASFKEYNIDAKEKLPRSNVPYIITCLFLTSSFSIFLSTLDIHCLLINKSFFWR